MHAGGALRARGGAGCWHHNRSVHPCRGAVPLTATWLPEPVDLTSSSTARSALRAAASTACCCCGCSALLAAGVQPTWIVPEAGRLGILPAYCMQAGGTGQQRSLLKERQQNQWYEHCCWAWRQMRAGQTNAHALRSAPLARTKPHRRQVEDWARGALHAAPPRKEAPMLQPLRRQP